MWSFSSFPSEKRSFKFQMCFLITAYCKVVLFFGRIHLEPVKVATISPSFHLAWAWRRWPTPRRSPESEGKHGQRRQTLGQFLKKKNPPRFRDTTWLGFFGVENNWFSESSWFFPQNHGSGSQGPGRWEPSPQNDPWNHFHDCWRKNFNNGLFFF